jgi:hypothetical protein
LRNIRSSAITTIKLPGEGVGTGRNYRGERLLPPAEEFFAAVQKDTVDTFMVSHPELISR